MQIAIEGLETILMSDDGVGSDCLQVPETLPDWGVHPKKRQGGTEDVWWSLAGG